LAAPERPIIAQRQGRQVFTSKRAVLLFGSREISAATLTRLDVMDKETQTPQ
jgi:hypothetical protein